MNIHAAYQNRLTQTLATGLLHEKAIAPREGHVLVNAADKGGLMLSALVRQSDQIVSEAAFSGSASPIEKGIAEVLCGVMESKTILECADHGMIYVERALRDLAVPVAVKGLVTPDNADPAFAMPQRLVRALLEGYRAETGYKDIANAFDRPVTPRWRALTEAQRALELQKVLDDNGMSRYVRLLGMEGHKRVVVQFIGELDNPGKQDLLVRLDKLLTETVEPTLQTVTQVKSDTNVVRIAEKKKSN